MRAEGQVQRVGPVAVAEVVAHEEDVFQQFPRDGGGVTVFHAVAPVMHAVAVKDDEDFVIHPGVFDADAVVSGDVNHHVKQQVKGANIKQRQPVAAVEADEKEDGERQREQAIDAAKNEVERGFRRAEIPDFLEPVGNVGAFLRAWRRGRKARADMFDQIRAQCRAAQALALTVATVRIFELQRDVRRHYRVGGFPSDEQAVVVRAPLHLVRPGIQHPLPRQMQLASLWQGVMADGDTAPVKADELAPQDEGGVAVTQGAGVREQRGKEQQREDDFKRPRGRQVINEPGSGRGVAEGEQQAQPAAAEGDGERVHGVILCHSPAHWSGLLAAILQI